MIPDTWGPDRRLKGGEQAREGETRAKPLPLRKKMRGVSELDFARVGYRLEEGKRRHGGTGKAPEVSR